MNPYRLGMVFISIVLMCLFTVVYVGHAISTNNRPMCNLVVTLTQPRPVPPDRPETESIPRTPTGEELVKYQKALEKYNNDSAAYDQDVSNKLRALSNETC